MCNPVVSICYIKEENILLFFLLLPIPFHKVQEELAQQSEKTSLASLKRTHILESMSTAFTTQPDQDASAPEGCKYPLFTSSCFPRKADSNLLSHCSFSSCTYPYLVLYLSIIAVHLKSTLAHFHCSHSIFSDLCLLPNVISVTL